jgi:CRISPR-associated endonuclease/helicase Cas3
LSEDLDLKHEIALVCDIQDRWDRREGWRKLAGRIAMISVSIFARPRFYPESIAENFKGQWVLREGYYSSEKGLLIEGETMII